MARIYSPGKFLEKAIQQSKDEMKVIRKYHPLSFILSILYLVGVICISLDVHPKFIYLTPINLLVSFGLVMYAHSKWDFKLAIFLFLAFFAGFSIEILGVMTGDIFGDYSYGTVLGPKFMGTPYMIGVNWMLLVYCAGTAVNILTDFKSRGILLIFAKSFLGALILVSLDVLIEPVAIIYDFWSWAGDGSVPIQNYIAWFVISFVLLTIFHLLVKDSKNKVAFALLVLQFLFFFFLGIKWF